MNVQGDGEGTGSNFRIFPAFSFSVFLLPVAADFCNSSHTLEKYCASRDVLEITDSDTWQTQGNKSILGAMGLSRFMAGDTWATQAQPWGVTNVGIGPASRRSMTVTNQWVAGMASKTFFMGLFGLSNRVLDVTSGSNSTFIESLRQGLHLNGTGFGYTAGCYQRNITASLVLSGYDSSRYDARTTLEVEIPGIDSISTNSPLFVYLASISFGGSGKTWQTGADQDTVGSAVVYIDSAIPHIWLPLSACKVFEEIFELQWDEAAQLYLVNATSHNRLQQLNTTVTFSLSPQKQGSTVKNFTMSYAAFDMKVTYPLVEADSYYFPLKRALSPDQYTFGRVFLQETYISVNYDMARFNISQATSDQANPYLHNFLLPPTNTTNIAQLPTGTYVGIGLGVGALSLMIALLVLGWRKGWWPFKRLSTIQNKVGEQSPHIKGELHGYAVPLIEAMGKERAELEAEDRVQEMDDPNTDLNYSLDVHGIHELDAEFSPSISTGLGRAPKN
jgi:hypothetical protein